MMILTRLLLSLTLGSLLVGCAGGSNPDLEAAKSIPENHRLVGKPVIVKDGGENLIFNEGRASGTGVFALWEKLESVSTGYRFNLNFSLEDEGSVSLFTFANSDLSQGFNILIMRLGSGPGSLRASLIADGRSVDISQVFKDYDASQNQELSFEIHNNEKPAHVILWKNGKGPFDHSNELAEIPRSPGSGKGDRIGLELKNATVESLEFVEADHH